MTVLPSFKTIRFSAALTAIAAVASMMVPASALAQACVGSANLPGQFSLNAGASFTDGANGYSLGSRTNLEGPIGFGADFGIIDMDDVDSNATSLSLEGSWDLPVEGIAACPVAGFSWSSWSDSFQGTSADVSAYGFPIGLSVGARMGDEAAFVFLPNARAGLVHTRVSFSVSDPIFGDVDDSDSENAFFYGGGITGAYGQFFASFGVSDTTLDGSDPVFSLGVGVLF